MDISGVPQLSASVSASCTAKCPFFQTFTARPDSSHLRALEGLVGDTGWPSRSRTGTEVWLYGEMCLVMVSLFWLEL